jgi:hypothetical protein
MPKRIFLHKTRLFKAKSFRKSFDYKVLHKHIYIAIFLDNTFLPVIALFCILFQHFVGKGFRYPFINDSRSDVNIGNTSGLSVVGKQLKGNF